MKKYYYKITLIFSFILFLFSCKEKSSHFYYSIIPENAPLVLAFTPEDILKKADVKEKWISYMQNCNSENENTNKKIENILRNGKESGIDTDEKFYLFALDNTYDNFGVVAKVENINKLTETFQSYIEYSGGYEEGPVKNGNYYQVGFDNQIVCVYNADRALFLTYSSDRTRGFEDARQLIQRDTTGSIINNASFKEMQKKNEDFVAMVQMNQVPHMQLSTMGIPANEVNNMDMLFTLDFQQGKINLFYKLLGDEKTMSPILEQQRKIFGRVKNDFLDFFPANTLGYLTGNINGEELYKSLNEQGAFNYVSESEKNNIETIMRSVNGDMAFGVTNVTGFGTPSFLLYADVNNKDIAHAISKIDFGSMGNMNNLGNNNYEYKMRYMPLSVYFGIVNDKFYATNDATLYSSLSEKPSNSFSGTKFANNLKNINFGGVINAAEILNLPAVGASLQMMGLNMPFYRGFLSELSYIEMFMHDNIETSLNIYLKNDKENSLKVMADKLYSF